MKYYILKNSNNEFINAFSAPDGVAYGYDDESTGSFIPALKFDSKADALIADPSLSSFIDSAEFKIIEEKTERLREFCNDYEFRSGLDHKKAALIFSSAAKLQAKGVYNSSLKTALSIAWLDTLWGDFYARAALITVDSTLNTDFSNHGSFPYTFLEIRTEGESL